MPSNLQERDDRLQIRCSEATANRFRAFAVGYANQEAALKELLQVARGYPSLLSRPPVWLDDDYSME